VPFSLTLIKIAASPMKVRHVKGIEFYMKPFSTDELQNNKERSERRNFSFKNMILIKLRRSCGILRMSKSGK
jgi:hypothetical protein